MASQGFGHSVKGQNRLGKAADVLFAFAQHQGKPLLLPMFPPDNHRGLQPGQIQPGHSEIPPDCDGIVVAIACNADDAQDLINLLTAWQRRRLARQGGDRP